MTNIHRAAEIIALATRGAHTTDGHPMKMSDHTAQVIAESLADAGLLAPDPQVIRTVDELEALDPETLCVTSMFGNVFPAMVLHKRPEHAMPAAVVASGAQVRAARTALQEATE